MLFNKKIIVHIVHIITLLSFSTTSQMDPFQSTVQLISCNVFFLCFQFKMNIIFVWFFIKYFVKTVRIDFLSSFCVVFNMILLKTKLLSNVKFICNTEHVNSAQPYYKEQYPHGEWWILQVFALFIYVIFGMS